MTNISGWLGVRRQAPYYTIGGAGAFTGDYTLVSASRSWWDRLSGAQRTALDRLVKETLRLQKALNWCADRMTYDKYGTQDPALPGAYWMSPAEASALVTAMGDRPTRYVKSKTPDTANKWVDLFVEEGRQLSKKHPPGSSWIEKLDCSKYAAAIAVR
jgi:TRAP-type C4-dicarboxylate transport system substrate-binding protein